MGLKLSTSFGGTNMRCLVPGYIKNDVAQLSNPYVREIPYSEVFPGRELNYGESESRSEVKKK